ncbi:hypothetical protein [Roseibium sp.]
MHILSKATDCRAHMRNLLVAGLLLFLTACGHIPLTTLIKLNSFDVLTTAPEELRVAVKYPDNIRIPKDGARMRLTLKEKSGGKMLMKKELTFEKVTSPAEKAELASELQTGWRIGIFRLPRRQVPVFEAFQTHLVSMSKAERDTMEGSLDISVDGCLVSSGKPGRIVVSTYLKAPELGGYVPLVRNADLEEMMAAEGLTDEAPLKDCT